MRGRRALVTGAARGLGRAIAARLIASGAIVAINDLDEPDVRAAQQALGAAAGVAGDVGDHAAAADLIRRAAAALGGPLDILVNNAGILRDGMLAKLTEADFDAVIRVNLKGVFSLTQAFVQTRQAAGLSGGAVVNLASVSAYGNVGQTNYSAAKAGVIGMTQTWALELAKLGIRVNAVAPGLIETAMTAGIPADVKDRLVARVPLRRLGAPEDVAAAVAFLASDDARYITGAVLTVDGGASVGGM